MHSDYKPTLKDLLHTSNSLLFQLKVKRDPLNQCVLDHVLVVNLNAMKRIHMSLHFFIPLFLAAASTILCASESRAQSGMSATKPSAYIQRQGQTQIQRPQKRRAKNRRFKQKNRRFERSTNRCFRFALSDYKKIYGAHTSLQKAQKFCQEEFSFSLFQSAYDANSMYGRMTRLKRAKAFALKNSDLRQRGPLLHFAQSKIAETSSVNFALKRAAKMVRKYPQARLGCVQTVFDEYRSTYSSFTSLRRALDFCSRR